MVGVILYINNPTKSLWNDIIKTIKHQPRTGSLKRNCSNSDAVKSMLPFENRCILASNSFAPHYTLE